MADLFDRRDIDQVTQTCNERGKPYGIKFGEIRRLSNSHRALEAAEFARVKGRYDALHSALFTAYFTHGRDIGNMPVLRELAAENGLDPDAMETAIVEGRFSEQVALGSEQAGQVGVTAIPTFLIEGAAPITGAVNESLFREALQAAAARQAES
ncbi:hypothetical protein PSDVSF_20900 [Pseudodesulfovibrio sediminis]|uniref:DSBA-like thioredoxin domain-containing protein n=1 Tax=Pseudodesulfovibrio sediminis TaxID=2810563 RepID=A0ABM7P5E3_9BACT|nr:hypothetical protein PSDVSF_20900 [Pseudodesulfovibrio sediminis]